MVGSKYFRDSGVAPTRKKWGGDKDVCRALYNYYYKQKEILCKTKEKDTQRLEKQKNEKNRGGIIYKLNRKISDFWRNFYRNILLFFATTVFCVVHILYNNRYFFLLNRKQIL